MINCASIGFHCANCHSKPNLDLEQCVTVGSHIVFWLFVLNLCSVAGNMKPMGTKSFYET